MNSIYTDNVLNRGDELSFLPSLDFEKRPETVDYKSLHPDLFNISLREYKRGIYYISDIHLEHRLFQKFGRTNISDSMMIKYLEELVDGLLLDDDGNKIRFSIPATILILGDTSHSFAISKKFYEILSKKCDRDIFVVLGNHELWEFNSVDDAISAYRGFFDSLPNIYLLQNSLYIDRSGVVVDEWFNDSGVDLQGGGKETFEERHKYWMEQCIISEDELRRMSVDELRKTCLDSKAIVFGTIGFSPLNKIINASQGIYRDTIKTVAQEEALAKEASDMYEKLIAALPNSHLVIASHMPLNDWTSLSHQDKWTYFNGHTHRNERILDERGHIYADNQVGYNGKRVKFNAILVEDRYDYFAYYEDGIYDITEKDYRKFYYGTTKWMSSVDKRGGDSYRIIMLKNKGIYLFLFQNESGKLYLLEGGKHREIKNQNIEYYYNNMVLLNQSVAESIISSGIGDFLEKISAFVKHIGSSGRRHGNIVDVDFFNHIMIDFRNYKMIPYFAYSVNDRYEYPDFPKLLQDNRPDLYKRFIENGGSSSLPSLKVENGLSQAIKHSTDTSIYADSNMMLKIQDMLDYNVIRFWNDDLIDAISSRADKVIDSGKYS